MNKKCCLVITNMKTVQNFDTVSDNFNVNINYRFKSWPRDRLSYLRVFAVFLSPSRQLN
jgi:hypothetical protein